MTQDAPNHKNKKAESPRKKKSFTEEPYIDYATGEVVDESVIRHRPPYDLGSLDIGEEAAEWIVRGSIEYLEKYRIDPVEIVESYSKDGPFRFALIRAFERAGYSIKIDVEGAEVWGAHFPIAAPRLWTNRNKKTEFNPASFLRTVYAKWLPYMARQDIIHFDKPLYVSYAQWIRPERHPEDEIEFARGYSNAKIIDPSEAIERRRASVRDASARYRAKKSDKMSHQPD